MRPSSRIDRLHQPTGWPRRADALAWAAAAKPGWRYDDDRPNLAAMGADTGVPYSTLWRLDKYGDTPVSVTNATDLAKGVAKASGLPPLVAFFRIVRAPSLIADAWPDGADTADELIAAFKDHVAAYSRIEVLDELSAA